MNEPIICKVDEDTYNSGRLTGSLRFYKSRSQEMRFFDARCNWTVNKVDEKYYHIMAEDKYQAEELARQTYAEGFHIGKSFVSVDVSYL